MNMHAVMNGDKGGVARAAGESEATETARQLSPGIGPRFGRRGFFQHVCADQFGRGPIAAARSHDAACIFGAS